MDFNGAILIYRANSLFRLEIVERFHQSIPLLPERPSIGLPLVPMGAAFPH